MYTNRDGSCNPEMFYFRKTWNCWVIIYWVSLVTENVWFFIFEKRINSTLFVRFYVVRRKVQLLDWNNYVGYNFIFLLLRIIPRKSIIKFYDVLCYKTNKNLTKYISWKYMWRSINSIFTWCWKWKSMFQRMKRQHLTEYMYLNICRLSW